MVLENTDDAMVEARTLLRQWVEQAPDTALTIPTDASSQLSQNLALFPSEDRLATQRSKTHIKNLIREAVDSDSPSTKPTKPLATTQDPRITMQARQNLARERRELMEKKRMIERESKIRDREDRMAFELRRRELEESRTQRKVKEKWMMDVAVRTAKMDLERRLEGRKGGEKGFGGLVGEKPSDPEPLNNGSQQKDEDSSKNHAEQPTQEDESIIRAREARAAKAEEMYLKGRFKSLKKHFNAWSKTVSDTRLRIGKFHVIKSFRLQTRTISLWRRNHQKRVAKREALALQTRLKQDQERLLRALRFSRSTTMSKAFVSWWGWSRTQREERLLKKQHEDRAKQMRIFLSRLEAKRMRDTESSKPVEEPPSPQPVLPPFIAEKAKAIKERVYGVHFDPLPLSPPPLSTVIVESDAAQVEDSPKGVDVISKEEEEKKEAGEEQGGQGVIEEREVMRVPPLKLELRVIPGVGVKKIRSGRSGRSETDRVLIENMEKREAERKERRRVLEEKRRQKELEKEAAQKAADLARLEAEAAAKAALALERKFLEQQQAAHLALLASQKAHHQSLVAKAKSHYTNSLLRRQGLEPLKKLVEKHKKEFNKGEEWRRMVMGRRHLRVWRAEVERRWGVREWDAGRWGRERCKRRFWRIWKEKLQTNFHTQTHASHHHIQTTKRYIFSIWLHSALEKRRKREEHERRMEELADGLALRLVPKRYLRLWKTYVKNQKEEKWREYRKQVLRDRVKELLVHSRFEAKLQVESITNQPAEPDHPPQRDETKEKLAMELLKEIRMGLEGAREVSSEVADVEGAVADL
ncbi:hypothetical protein HK097_004352 [Rhizophlyctis rosea]|uniref:Uncharacterized protein n=1 Tax=Rhizophlyctis rosea TaxID=64517 RepID=A0AAD5SH90_9FUNG|nr:hypothetical protein HK097_004352 [Rhizophlyctis rosea]